jgi:hypothetical protein
MVHLLSVTGVLSNYLAGLEEEFSNLKIRFQPFLSLAGILSKENGCPRCGTWSNPWFPLDRVSFDSCHQKLEHTFPLCRYRVTTGRLGLSSADIRISIHRSALFAQVSIININVKSILWSPNSASPLLTWGGI